LETVKFQNDLLTKELAERKEAYEEQHRIDQKIIILKGGA